MTQEPTNTTEKAARPDRVRFFWTTQYKRGGDFEALKTYIESLEQRVEFYEKLVACPRDGNWVRAEDYDSVAGELGQVKQRVEELEERIRILVAVDKQIHAEKNAEIATLKARLANEEAVNEKYRLSFDAKDAEIARLKTELAQMSEWHDHAGNRAEKAEARIAELENNLTNQTNKEK